MEEGSGISKITDPDYKLKSDARLVKKGIHTQYMTDERVKEMFDKKLITEKEFRAW